MGKHKKRKSTKGNTGTQKKRWGATQKKFVTVAGIAAIVGIVVCGILKNSFSDDVDYSNAPQVASAQELSEYRSYTGKLLIQGTMTGTPYTFAEMYKGVAMEEKPEVEGSFLYTELVISFPEKYVINQKEVKIDHVPPKYDTRWVGHYYTRQAEDLKIFDLPIDTEKVVMVNLTDRGTLYDSLKEKAQLKAVEGTQLSAVLLCDMENGKVATGNLYVNSTDLQQAINDAEGGLIVFDVLLWIWLGLCGIVILSMYLQRYDNMSI